MNQKPPDVPPVVLLVEDEALVSRMMKRLLERETSATVLVAETVSEAQTLFEAHPEITLVIMDANVPFTTDPRDEARRDKLLMTTEHLTRAFRTARPDLVMVTSSSSPDSRERLVEAGCNFEAEKEHVLSLVLKLLKTR